MDDNNGLMLKFQELIRFYHREVDKTGVTLGDILQKIPRYYTAYMDQVKEMEAAFFDDSLQRMNSAMERAKKLYSRAAEEYGKVMRGAHT